MLGVMAWLMPLSVAISTFGSANGTIFAAGRLCYVASREGHLVDILSFVHKENLTPAPALLFNVRILFNLTKFFVTPKKDRFGNRTTHLLSLFKIFAGCYCFHHDFGWRYR